MEGIDRIKSHILEQAQEAARAIILEAVDFAGQETAKAEKTSQALLDEARQGADQEAALILKRAESMAAAQARKKGLEQKQAYASQILDRALELLQNKPEEEKVRLYVSWISGLGLDQGVITLGARDHEQIGEQLIAALPEGAFSLDGQPGDFAGGLLVTHGRMRDNLTFDRVLRDHRPELARLALLEMGDDSSEAGQDG